jgi:hypothetical protein
MGERDGEDIGIIEKMAKKYMKRCKKRTKRQIKIFVRDTE